MKLTACHTETIHTSLSYIINFIFQPNWTELAKVKQAKLRWRKQNINLIWTWKLLDYHLIWIIRLEFNFLQFYWTKNFMLNLIKNGTWTSFLYIKNSIFNLKRNLKIETFDDETFLYKVHELLLITLHCQSTDQKCSWVIWSICIGCQQMSQFFPTLPSCEFRPSDGSRLTAPLHD